MQEYHATHGVKSGQVGCICNNKQGLMTQTYIPKVVSGSGGSEIKTHANTHRSTTGEKHKSSNIKFQNLDISPEVLKHF